MATNFNLLFYLKKQKNYEGKGPAHIYMRITVEGKRAEISTGRECEPSKWNSRAGRGTGTKEDIKSLNAFLDRMQTKVYDAQQQLMDSGESISAEVLKNAVLGKTEKPRMLIEIFKKHNTDIATLIAKGSKEFAKGTLDRYETALKHTQDFLKWNFSLSDYDIKKIDLAFIKDFEFYLRTERKCANNSAVKYIRNFGKIIRLCLENQWLLINPFMGYKGKIKAVRRGFLSEEEIERITYKEFATERLSQVRDVFLFSCYTGLSYADSKKLRTHHIVDRAGSKWIIDSRQKTDIDYNIPLLPPALALLEKYKDNPVCMNKSIPLPVLSNQKMNDYLKEIAAVCAINQTLTFHIARHTFATLMLLNGVPIETVSKMMGHTNIKTTQIYGKILDLKVGRDMEALTKRLYLGDA